VDPFRVFNPAALGLAGGLFLALLLGISTVVYRPWCRFCCPFGLVAQVPARFALLRIRRNPAACSGCASCANACPTGAMIDILADAPRVRDCFACGSCLEACPTGSVRFGRRPSSLL
jgi:polyferredoxin